ncbi:MAG: hypothetical protein EGR20_13525 [Alistipes onderdonkii]|nr:hypothetical protein [Alistipes onderdonkii]
MLISAIRCTFHSRIFRQNNGILAADTAVFFDCLNNLFAIFFSDFRDGLFCKPRGHINHFFQIPDFVARCVCLVLIKIIVTAQQCRWLQFCFGGSNILVCYFTERLEKEFALKSCELRISGDDAKACGKLLKGYFKRIVCE